MTYPKLYYWFTKTVTRNPLHLFEFLDLLTFVRSPFLTFWTLLLQISLFMTQLSHIIHSKHLILWMTRVKCLHFFITNCYIFVINGREGSIASKTNTYLVLWAALQVSLHPPLVQSWTLKMKHICLMVAKLETNASGAIWSPKLEPMQWSLSLEFSFLLNLHTL